MSLLVCFALLCARELTAAIRESTEVWPALILVAGSMGLGAWRPAVALFAFTLSVPLLSGLSQSALLSSIQPVGLAFSSLWLGIAVRGWRSEEEACSQTQRFGPFHFCSPALIIDLLITALLLSLAVQLWRHRDTAGLWPAFISRRVFGYGDPFYFLTSAFLWLQGLFYFRALRSLGKGPGTTSHVPAAVSKMGLKAWTKPVLATYVVTMVIFFLFQGLLHVPENSAEAGFQSPFEDISSYGSITVTVFVFWAAVHRWSTWPRRAFNIISLICLFTMMVASWSRAAWLAGLIFVLIIAWLRLPRRWLISTLATVMIAILFINLNADRGIFQSQLYLARLVALVRIEKVTNKSPERINLYHKAFGMIRQHPLMGHGIGSFYLTSRNYAQAGDRLANYPDFAHDVFLQLAAEEGLPVAAMFAGLIGWMLWRGWRGWQSAKSSWPMSDDREPTGTAQISRTDPFIPLGVMLALGAYLETGLTGNSLNVYISNQLLFWFLMAVLATSQREREREGEGESESESGEGKNAGIVSGSM